MIITIFTETMGVVSTTHSFLHYLASRSFVIWERGECM